MKTILFSILITSCYCTAEAQELRTIHVFVALCDNVNQGIVHVPEKIGNGQDPKSNLYWKNYYFKLSNNSS